MESNVMKNIDRKCLKAFVVLIGFVVGQQAYAQDSCQIQLRIEDAPGGAFTEAQDSYNLDGDQVGVVVPKEGAFEVEGYFTEVPWGVNNNLLFVRDRDCRVEGLSVEITVGETAYPVQFDGQFGGMTCGGTTFEWPTGAEPWAGCFTNGQAALPTDWSAGATFKISRADTPPPAPEECEEGVHLEEAFGGATYDATDCANPVYTFPAGANDAGPIFPWAGFADLIAADGAYPYSFPYGGEITFTASSATAEAQRVRFKFEREGFPGDTTGFYTDWVDVPAELVGGRSALSVSFDGSEGEYNNFLMYIEKTDPADTNAITMTGLAVVPAAAPPPPPAPPAAPATPVPALPLWGLLGLVGLVGLFGFRRRR